MTKARRGDYMIYKLYNRHYNLYTTEFFLPDRDSRRRKRSRLKTLDEHRVLGYMVVGVSYVDKETYLNARLTQTVEEYLYEDNAEQVLREKFSKELVSKEVYDTTLKMINDYKATCLRNINRQVSRLIKGDFDIENEIAIQLNDQYTRSII